MSLAERNVTFLLSYALKVMQAPVFFGQPDSQNKAFLLGSTALFDEKKCRPLDKDEALTRFKQNGDRQAMAKISVLHQAGNSTDAVGKGIVEEMAFLDNALNLFRAVIEETPAPCSAAPVLRSTSGH